MVALTPSSIDKPDYFMVVCFAKSLDVYYLNSTSGVEVSSPLLFFNFFRECMMNRFVVLFAPLALFVACSMNNLAPTSMSPLDDSHLGVGGGYTRNHPMEAICERS